MRMPSVSRRQALAYAVVLLALLALVGRSLVGGASGSDATSATDAAAASDATPALVVDTPAADAEGTESLLVHVVGAVRHPGVYELASGARVADAVERAGGPRARAVLESINLAAELIDGQQVVVPARPRPAAAAQARPARRPRRSARAREPRAHPRRAGRSRSVRPAPHSSSNCRASGQSPPARSSPTATSTDRSARSTNLPLCRGSAQLESRRSETWSDPERSAGA